MEVAQRQNDVAITQFGVHLPGEFAQIVGKEVAPAAEVFFGVGIDATSPFPDQGI